MIYHHIDHDTISIEQGARRFWRGVKFAFVIDLIILIPILYFFDWL